MEREQSRIQGVIGGRLVVLSSSLNSFTRVVSPLLGSLLLSELAGGGGIAGALLMVGVVYFTWDQILHVPDIDCEPVD